MRKILMAVIGMLVAIGTTVAGADVTVTVEHSVGGVIVREGHVRASHVNYNFGGSLSLQAGGLSSSPRLGMLEFRNIFGNGRGQVPRYQVIQAATLRLYARNVVSEATGSPVEDKFRVHPLAVDLSAHYGNKDGAQADPGQMCWSYRSWESLGWGSAGAGSNGPVYGEDYRIDDYGQVLIHTDDDGTWVDCDVTDLVQAWQDHVNGLGGYANFGMLIRNVGDNGVISYFDTTNRTSLTDPELVVTCSAATHFVLEHGVNGVTSRDGHVRLSHPELSFGGATRFQVGGAPAQLRYGMVEFNHIFGRPGVIPLDRPVAQATLRLYADSIVSQQTGSPVEDKFRVHPLRVDLTDHYGYGDGAQALAGEMCWSYRIHPGGPEDPNEGWGVGGATHSGPVWNVDYDAYVYDDTYIHTDDDGTWVEWDVTAMVSAWQYFENGAGGYENLGFLLRNSGDHWVLPYFAANNWTSTIDPQLVVDVVPLPTNCSEAQAQGYSLAVDLNSDCYVDLTDLAIFASRWLDCVSSEDADCRRPWE